MWCFCSGNAVRAAAFAQTRLLQQQALSGIAVGSAWLSRRLVAAWPRPHRFSACEGMARNLEPRAQFVRP